MEGLAAVRQLRSERFAAGGIPDAGTSGLAGRHNAPTIRTKRDLSDDARVRNERGDGTAGLRVPYSRALEPARRNPSPVRAEADPYHMALDSDGSNQLCACFSLPNESFAFRLVQCVNRSGRDPLPIRAEAGMTHFAFVAQGFGNRLPSPGVPDSGGFIQAGGDDAPAIRTKLRIHHRIRMAQRRANRLPRACIPHPRSLVQAGG